MNKFLFAFLLLPTSLAWSSFEGIEAKLQEVDIAGFTRPCCGFSLDVILSPKIIDPTRLGDHSFARVNEKQESSGIAYSCDGGFLDLGHLRDTADWAAHIRYFLPQWIGSGWSIRTRDEGGYDAKVVHFPRLPKTETDALSPRDLDTLAISITNDLALMHEIPTAFNIAVTLPGTIYYERGSAFSLEDAYSNLLGAYLGVEAASSRLPYNRAMTGILVKTLSDLGVQSKDDTLLAFDEVKGTFWVKKFMRTFRSVLKRDFTYYGEIVPFLIRDTALCQAPRAKPLRIPELLGARPVARYYDVRGALSKKHAKELKKLGVEPAGGVLTRRDIPSAIEAIRIEFRRELGEHIEDR